MLWRVLVITTLSLIATGCGDNNQAEISNLRAQVELSRKETSDLKSNISTEVKNLKERIERLEAQPTKTEAAKTLSSSSGDAAPIGNAIAECVRKVRSLETQPKGFGQPYAEFDAFYNPGSGRVENNNRYVDQGPTYAFNKCMASKGVPLTYN
jgi:hypothetical protein